MVAAKLLAGERSHALALVPEGVGEALALLAGADGDQAGDETSPIGFGGASRRREIGGLRPYACASFKASNTVSWVTTGFQVDPVRAINNKSPSFNNLEPSEWRCAEAAHLNREHLYRMLSEGGNPELRSLGALLDALGFRLGVELKATHQAS